MERKIGEIFEFGGEWYQCVEGLYCDNCAFVNDNCEDRERITLREKLTKQPTTGFCNSEKRNDRKSVIFKKLEKAGEPFSDYYPSGRVICFQRYKCYQKPIVEEDIIWHWVDDTIVDIEIKQNKEDMEEKKLNLKPFDIQKAREGKPVCTRDGRKARIICFDAKRKDEKNIIALVPSKDYPGFLEDLIAYPNNGNYYGGHENDEDLMMLPEKKEGWVNIYKSSIYKTKEDAFNRRAKENYLTTIKIEWEE